MNCPQLRACAWIMHHDRALESRVLGHLHEFESLARQVNHGGTRSAARQAGCECLRSYRTEWDEKALAFMKTHNWVSHGADACRLALVARRCASRRRRRCPSAYNCRT